MIAHDGTISGLAYSFLRQRGLIWELAKRDVLGRYRGSMLGLLWTFFHPLLMLGIYTFTFSVVFKARWAGSSGGSREFAVMVFAGMIVHGMFAECMNRSPSLITSHPNYVKKVVFPIEILPWSIFLSALFHFTVSFLVLVAFCIAGGYSIAPTILLLPLVIFPVALLTMGLSWMLSSLGVYIRDINQGIGIVTTVFLFLSPVFYPASALPPDLSTFLYLNPLTIPIEQLREIVIGGVLPDFYELFVSILANGLVAWLGFYWFQKTRKGFADVI